MKIIVISGTEEWEGLYIDGTLVYEDHSLRARKVLDILAERGEAIESLDYYSVKQAVMIAWGSLPIALDHKWIFVLEATQ